MKTRKWILLFVSLNLLAFAFARTANAQEPYVPGAPGTNFLNPGGKFIATFESVYSSVRPANVYAGTNLVATSVLAGDIVLLLNANGGDAITNWAAVVTFFNPADPDFTQGLEATEDEAFFDTNTFANLTLPANTYYTSVNNSSFLPALPDGSFGSAIIMIGPDGGIAPGQIDTMYLLAYSTVSVPEPSSAALLGSALAAAIFAFRKKIGR